MGAIARRKRAEQALESGGGHAGAYIPGRQRYDRQYDQQAYDADDEGVMPGRVRG